MLKHIRTWAVQNPANREIVDKWLEARTSLFLRSLSKPTNDEIPIFIELAVEDGGVQFLRDQ